MNTDTNSLSYSEPSLRDRITRTAFVWGAGYKNHITNEVPLGAIVLNADLSDSKFGSVTTLCGKTTSTGFLDFDGNINPTNICKSCAAKAGK